MRRLLVFLILVPALSIFTASLPAQEQPVSCDPVSVAEKLNTMTSILASLDERMDTDTPTALRADLRIARSILMQLDANCFEVITTPQLEATPTPQPMTYFINSTQGVNARSCPRTSCNVITVLSSGEEIQSIGTTAGDTVSGSSEWYQINVDGEDAFVHSSLVSRNRPPTPAPLPTSAPVQVAPVQQVQPQPNQQSAPVSTPQPLQPPPVAPQFSCNCSKTCEQMASCDEAYFQLNTCGCGRRDGDNDGVPCESICPGG